jgi:hypothetical protein
MAMPTADLLEDLDARSELARLVQRVKRERVPWIVVPGAAVAGWTRRDPEAWAKFSAWLAEQGEALVRI